MPDPWEEIEAAYETIGHDLFGRDDLRHALSERTPDESAFFTLVLVGAEIDNGGFSQFFTNSTGELIAEAIGGAERFGLTEHARVLRDASERLFPGGVPIDHEERLARWELLDDTADEAIEGLDERWYALEEPLKQRLHTFVRTR